MLRLFAVLLLAAGAAAAQKKPVTMEAASAEQRPAAAVRWAPDGKRFVWQEGRKLWIYDVAARSRTEAGTLDALELAAGKPRAPSVFQWENRRVREEKIQWFPSGNELLLLVNGELFRYPLETRKWKQVTFSDVQERDPKLSPGGGHISFRRGNDLYALDLTTRQTARLTHDGSATLWNGRLDWVYPEELDLGTAHWWSPDSKWIAYLQFDVGRQHLYPHADLVGVRAVYEPQRYPKAGTPNAEVRLGVVSAAGGETRWMNLGEPRDALLARVCWLPGSNGLAVQRMNRVQNRLDLLAADAATGTTKTILSESSATWVNVGDDPWFLKDGKRFLWTSERDGYRHLYLYSLEGRLVKRLTEGAWEVTGIAGVDESARMVYYVSTEHNPLERHLYRVSLRGGKRERISRKTGTHAVSMAPDAGCYLDTVSSLTEPLERTVHRGDGSQWDVFQAADRKPLDEYNLAPVEIVPVRSSDGALLYARLVRPADFQPGKKYPAVVTVYGGPHSQAVVNRFYGLSFDQVLAARGFVAWQLDNRGGAGRGRVWEDPLYRRLGARELADQQEGVKHLVSTGFVDARRIAVHGWSYGGFLTLYALLQAPDLFRAGIAGAPVTDWRNYDTIYTERYLGMPAENPEGYRLSSPVHLAEKLKAQLMLIHNLEDDNVLFQHTVQMADALARAGKQFELRFYSQKTHGVTGPARKHMWEAMLAFFERQLRPAE